VMRRYLGAGLCRRDDAAVVAGGEGKPSAHLVSPACYFGVVGLGSQGQGSAPD
jgi:hypothetical protein